MIWVWLQRLNSGLGNWTEIAIFFSAGMCTNMWLKGILYVAKAVKVWLFVRWRILKKEKTGRRKDDSYKAH